MKSGVVFGGIAVLLLLIVFQVIYFNKKDKEAFLQFYSAQIDGKLTAIDAGARGVSFTVNDVAYRFKPYTSVLNEKKIFHHLVEPGDRILKAAYSDTLFLFHRKKTYNYTFQIDYAALE
jgi:hypothetical protein